MSLRSRRVSGVIEGGLLRKGRVAVECGIVSEAARVPASRGRDGGDSMPPPACLECVGCLGLGGEEMVDFSLTDEQRAIQEPAGEFPRREVDPIVEEIDESQKFPYEVM